MSEPFRFASALSTAEKVDDALRECGDALAEQLGDAPDLIVAFYKHDYGAAVDAIPARLHERFTWANTAALERLDALQRGFDAYGSAASDMALKAMTNTVRIQGLVMAFEDVFLSLTVLFLAMACAVPMIRRPNAGAGGGGGH